MSVALGHRNQGTVGRPAISFGICAYYPTETEATSARRRRESFHQCPVGPCGTLTGFGTLGCRPPWAPLIPLDAGFVLPRAAVCNPPWGCPWALVIGEWIAVVLGKVEDGGSAIEGIVCGLKGYIYHVVCVW